MAIWSVGLRGFLVTGVLSLVLAIGAGRVEKTGNDLQVALPLLAWGCAAANGDAVEYLGRYLVMLGSVHAAKWAFGDAAFNRRPRGDSFGMPSAHTATAALGASRLAGDCLAGNPVAAAVSVLAAGFVGGSRIAAGAHDLLQVLIGAAVGLLADRAFGKGSRGRDWLRHRLRLRRQVSAAAARRDPSGRNETAPVAPAGTPATFSADGR